MRSQEVMVGSEIIEPPWRDSAKSDLWAREREIRELVSNGYSVRQIIRILDLKVGGKQVSRTWVSTWIARNGMRMESDGAINADGSQKMPRSPTAVRALAEQQDRVQGARTVRQRADSKAERYVSEHPVSPVLSRLRKEPT